MSKQSKCLPYVDRRPDGTVYSQHRIPEDDKPSHDCEPTYQSHCLLVDKEAREDKRQKRLRKDRKT